MVNYDLRIFFQNRLLKSGGFAKRGIRITKQGFTRELMVVGAQLVLTNHYMKVTTCLQHFPQFVRNGTEEKTNLSNRNFSLPAQTKRSGGNVRKSALMNGRI
jgi:hypothetical protein